MKHEKSRLSFIEDLLTVRKLVESRYPEINGRLFDDMLSKLAHYHYNKKNQIVLGREWDVYDLLIKNSYNPFTVYRWFLLERIPDDVHFQLKNRQISQKIASKIHFKRRHESKSKVCVDIKIMGLNLVRSM